MCQFGVAPDRVMINAQIDNAIKRGKPGEAVEIFERALEGVSPALRNTGQIHHFSLSRPALNCYAKYAIDLIHFILTRCSRAFSRIAHVIAMPCSVLCGCRLMFHDCHGYGTTHYPECQHDDLRLLIWAPSTFTCVGSEGSQVCAVGVLLLEGMHACLEKDFHAES